MINKNKKNVFVPKYGAGIMEDVKNYCKDDSNRIYVIISLIIQNINLYIPKENIENYNIRNISSMQDIYNGFDIIKSVPEKIEKKWSMRYRKNNDKIKRGDMFEICEVIRDLYFLRKTSSMPSGEAKILLEAQSMLASEVSLALNIKFEEAMIKIRQLGE